MIRVLVIAPQKHTAEGIARALDGQRMLSTTVSEGTQGLEQLDQSPPHAVVLAMGPRPEQGEELCRAVCERTLAPVLVVGTREQDLDVERVLGAGADAHVLEPFANEVLVAQLWALLRRVGLVAQARPV